jgi:hypothetical protein
LIRANVHRASLVASSPPTGLLVVLTVVPLAFLAADWVRILGHPSGLMAIVGIDYQLYVDAALRFLNGGDFYYSWQYVAPYGQESLPILYPPEALALLIPFTVIPAVVWWLIPISVTTALIVSFRPRLGAYPALALCLWWPETIVHIVTGNPVVWVTMFVALGTRYRWPSALGAVLKPTLAPFALIDARDRRWWFVAGLALLPFCWLLPSYVSVLTKFKPTFGLAYSFVDVPLVLMPIISYVARQAR